MKAQVFGRQGLAAGHQQKHRPECRNERKWFSSGCKIIVFPCRPQTLTLLKRASSKTIRYVYFGERNFKGRSRFKRSGTAKPVSYRIPIGIPVEWRSGLLGKTVSRFISDRRHPEKQYLYLSGKILSIVQAWLRTGQGI